MGVPKKKTSHSRKGTRRSHLAMGSINVSNCSRCNQPVLPHHVCINCGYYKGKKIIDIKVKKKNKKQSK